MSSTSDTPPIGPALKRKAPKTTTATEISRANVQESQRTVGNRDSSLPELTHRLTCYKFQCRGSSLWSWALCEDSSFTSFREYTRRAGVEYRSLQTEVLAGDFLIFFPSLLALCWPVPFLVLIIFLICAISSLIWSPNVLKPCSTRSTTVLIQHASTL